MERVQIKQIFDNMSAYADQEITVAGWARTIRDSKVFGFIELNDGSCFRSTQIVFEEEKEKFVIGNITFSKENSELYNEKMVLKLNKEECDIMEILAKNSERSIFKEELCSRIFEGSNNDNNEALNMYMSFLKDKFEALGSDSIIDESNGYIIKRNISL